MNFTPFPELKTDRLVLRQLQPTDWKEIVFLRSDKEVNKFVKRPQAKNQAEALTFIEKITKATKNNESLYWCITLKGQQEMIGSISLWNFSKDLKTAEVGYDLHPKYQGLGIMNEAMKTILNFGFNALNFQKIEAYTHRNNEASKRLLLKNNFKHVKERIDPEDADNIIFELSFYNFAKE